MIYLLCGYKRSGKDTAANWLKTHRNFHKLSFAEKLREEVASAYKIRPSVLTKQELKELPLVNYPAVAQDLTSNYILNYFIRELKTLDGKTPISGMIINGKMYGTVSLNDQSLYELYHTPRSLMIINGALRRAIDPNYWIKAVANNMPAGQAVISDWRFPNEADFLKGVFSKQIKTVRIVREPAASNDPSERSLDDYPVDVIIDNQGTKDQLIDQLEKL